METEILEIPQSLLRTRAAFFCGPQSEHWEQARDLIQRTLKKNRGLTLLGCGSSRVSAQLAAYWLEFHGVGFARALSPSELVASGWGELWVGLSQSGATRDLIAALTPLHESGAAIIGASNCPGSPLAKLSQVALTLSAGPENAIPATKSFATMNWLMLSLSGQAGFLAAERLPESLEQWMSSKAFEGIRARVRELAREWSLFRTICVLGRGVFAPLAREGALKIKEAALLPSEGFETGEFFHGPLALADAQLGVVVMAESESDLKRLQTAGVPIFSLSECDLDGDLYFKSFAAAVILDLFALELGRARGCDVDRPRHLAKSL